VTFWRTEKDMKQTPSFFDLLDRLECAAFEVDAGGTVGSMNQAMIRVLGQGRGMKWYEYLNQPPGPFPWPGGEGVAPGNAHRDIYVKTLDRTYDLAKVASVSEEGTPTSLCILRDVTAHRQTERKLRKLEQDYLLLFEHVGSGVFLVNRQGELTSVNHALIDMLAYKGGDELIGKLVGKHLFRRLEDYKTVRDLVARRGVIVDTEVDLRQKNGKPISVLLTVHPRHDLDGSVMGYEGIVSRRRKLLKEVQEAHDFLRSIIQNSPNAIIGTDLDGQIILWNRGAEEILGYKAKDVVGHMNMKSLYPEGKGEVMPELLRKGGGRLTGYPTVFERQDGRTVEGSLSASIVADASGREATVVSIFVDLGERLQMERRLRQTQDQLLQSEKLAAVGRLTSQIAHELNNPLYGIMNTLELMKTEVDPQSRRRRLLEMALSEIVRLTELLRKMLSFSRPDQDEKHPVDINTILDEILLLHEKQLRENDIHLTHSFADGLGKVLASKNQLRQVFLNMISNARDAMPDGGTLTVVTKVERGNVQVEFTDTGTGIRPENLDKIFDAFFTTKDSVKGVGLGLSVCYVFIKEHGGDIKVDSAWGSGTTFTVSLPTHPGGDEKT
jgi:PAS domain S-box-containing protein